MKAYWLLAPPVAVGFYLIGCLCYRGFSLWHPIGAAIDLCFAATAFGIFKVNSDADRDAEIYNGRFPVTKDEAKMLEEMRKVTK